jgi:hypothetical protein
VKRFQQTFAFLLAATLANVALADSDPLRAALEESKATGKGLSLYVHGQTIGGVVVSVDDHYVVARSQAQGTIVIRLDRIDGVAGFVTLPVSERKAQ